MSANDLIIPDEQRGRQAVASLGGYAHQLFTTLQAWMRVSPDEALLVEVAEDYAILSSDALTMTQVKRETGATSLTLRREDVKKAIVSLWQFAEANPGRDIRLHFLTTAPMGKERDMEFPGGVGGIAYWVRAAIGQDVTPLRNFLLSLDWPPDLAAFLKEADNETLRSRLLRRIVWLTGQEPTEVAIDTLSSRLELLAVERGMPPSDGARVLPQLLLDLLQIILRDDRRLTRLDFERAWEKATTVAVPLSAVRMMAGGATPTGPDYTDFALDPLPKRLSLRAATVDRLAGIVRSGAVPWIHGSSGLGKSRLATLLTAHQGGLWHIVRLRGLSLTEIRQALRQAIATLDRPGLSGIILDDLPIPLIEPWRRYIRPIASEAARLGLVLVVTAERAPLAPAGDDFAPWQLETVIAPYLDVAEVSEIVRGAQGDPDVWAQILHLTCGAGHPLFIDARIAGLASRGWPQNERLAGLLSDGQVSELQDVRASVALRLLSELDPEAHTLLLRLSVLIGVFDRELVMAVAETHRALMRPGVLLDFLIGPWIESAGKNRLKLSPLLASAGTEGLGDAEYTAVRNATVGNLLARKPLHADFLSQLLMQSLAVRNMQGLSFIAGAVLTADNRRVVADACLPLAFLASKDGRLVPENQSVSSTLRLAQVVAVTVEPSHSALAKVLEEADAEFATLPEPIRSGSKFTMLLSLLASEEVRAGPELWMPRLLDYVALTKSGSVVPELVEGMGNPDLGGLTHDQFFFMVRSNKIGSLEDLVDLFRLLGEVDPALRRSWLMAATTLLGGPPLFIQAVWSTLAMNGQLDAAAALGTYRRIAALAEDWREPVTAVECYRAAAVMLDEYLGDNREALALLEVAALLHPDDARLARTTAGVLAHAGRHEEASALLSQIHQDYSVDEPLERTLMLQAAATSTAKAGDRRKAAALFLEAYGASQNVESLEPGIRVGLLCDAAVELGAAKEWAGALSVFADAHLAAEDLVDDGSERSWVAIQAVSQVALWLNATHEGRRALLLQDHPGTWSLLKPTIPEDKTGAVGLDIGLANGAILELRLGSDSTLLERYDERDRAGLVTSLSALALRSHQLASAIDRRDVTAFTEILPRFVATGKVRLERKAVDVQDTAAAIAILPHLEWGDTEWVVARHVASELMVELILDKDPNALKAAINRLTALGIGLDYPFHTTDAGQRYVGHALQALEWLIAPGSPDPASLVHVTITLFQWLTVTTRSTLRMRVWGEIRGAWLEVIHTTAGSSGKSMISDLVTLLNSGTGQIADVAKVALAGAHTAGVQLHPATVAMLEKALLN